jgi:ABC-type branched-subunit amino acid transport system permease subunit
MSRGSSLTALADRLRPGDEPPVPRGVLVAGAVAVVLAAYFFPLSPLPEWAPAGVVLVGAVFGTATGLMAMGLVLIYRSDRIINFAYGSMGAVGGVLAINLFLESGWNYFLALAVGVAAGAGVGALVDVLVVRRFTAAPRLILTVATIGLAQVLGAFELLIPVHLFDGGNVFLGGYATPLDMRVTIDPVVFTGDHLLILALVPAVVTAVAWFLLRTDAGVAIRGAAANRDRARLLGLPVRRLSLLVWAVAGGASALTFVLKAPFSGLAPGVVTGPAFILPALAAAVLARMNSLVGAVAAGIGIGVLEQIVLWNVDKPSMVDLVFLVVILAGLLLQRHRLSRADDGDTAAWSLSGTVKAIPHQLRGLPEVRAARIGLPLLLAAVAIVLPHLYVSGTVILFSSALVWVMVAVSLVLLSGWAGAISLGQFAIAAAGAVMAGNLITRWDLDLIFVLAAAGAAGAGLALVVGLPALRIKGLFLAVTTLASAVVLNSVVLNRANFPDLVPGRVPRPVLFGKFSLESEVVMYYVCLVLAVAVIALTTRMRTTRPGRVLVAARDNQRAAEAMAVPTTATRLSAFVLSGVIAGIAGGLHVLVLRGAGSGSYSPVLSLDVFALTVIGGLGSVAGAASGVVVFRWLEQATTDAARLLVTGAGLLLVLMVLPGGFAQSAGAVRDRLLRVVANRRGLTVPTINADAGARADDGTAAGSAGVADAAAELLTTALAEAPTNGDQPGATRRERAGRAP